MTFYLYSLIQIKDYYLASSINISEKKHVISDTLVIKLYPFDNKN